LVDPSNANRDDPEFEHLCFEGKDHRKIFTFDPVSYECVLDGHFWEKISSSDLLWLCGFHLVSEKYRNRVDLVSDMLAEAKCRVHLELGEGTETIGYAIRKLTDSGVMRSLGMNEQEARFTGLKGDPLENTGFLSDFMKAKGLERLTVHSREYRLTFFREDREKNARAGEESVRLSAAKAFGSIRENLGRVSRLERYELKGVRGDNLVLIPAYVTPRPKFLTGLGDACSIVDAMISLR
jgi:ADP-dependent phosphofructokinase/glucokinase